MRIHKEGRVFLMGLLIVLAGINLLVQYIRPEQWISTVVVVGSVMLFLFVLQFFRNPQVNSPMGKGVVLSPADGKVVAIETVQETEFLQEPRVQLSIFMSPLNVHVNRNPVTGIVKYFKYHPGKYLVAWHPKSSTENERTTLVVEMADGLQILFRQIAGAMARRIKCYISEGEKVVQGSEFGFIKFGSRLDVLLPEDLEIMVEIGDKTKAGLTVLARTKP